MGFSLVALDTDHIKEYVFGTDKLKEIRGASSILDRLNRSKMEDLAKEAGDGNWKKIFANGGSGLFLIESTKAAAFVSQVKQEYHQLTAGGASVTSVVQSLPADAPDDIESIMMHPMLNTLALLRYRLHEQKDHPRAFINEASHPLMRPCDSCGMHYAVKQASDVVEFYCQVCLNKQVEDGKVKKYIEWWIRRPGPQRDFESPLWKTILEHLQHYSLPDNTNRPEDLNVFSEFRQAKDYLGLIYADANGMGKAIENLNTLRKVEVFAENVDNAVYDAMCEVIGERLPVQQLGVETWIFPFDILLIGGDDIVLVTPAAQAMPFAHALAKRFYVLANKERKEEEEEHSLSVAVVLAPTNYPFSLMRDLAEDALKFAKKDGSKTFATKKSDYGKTRVNFLVVAGSTSQSFQKAYNHLRKKYKDAHRSFYATMRPYTLEQLEFLLIMLREGRQLSLGRTKLHQLREAILHRDLSTSVIESLAVLRTWRENERDFVVKKVYSTERGNSLLQWDQQNPAARFPVVTFPWFVENKENGAKHYSTLLLDFVELYDFVAREGGDEQ
ncbi:MAG TPA: hypothetical protein VII61_10180 [Ktedonobacteraceae bacterium]